VDNTLNYIEIRKKGKKCLSSVGFLYTKTGENRQKARIDIGIAIASYKGIEERAKKWTVKQWKFTDLKIQEKTKLMIVL
jgi:hypothetical protein